MSEFTEQWPAAEWHYSRLLEATPGDPALLANRAVARANQRKWPQAIQDLDRLFAAPPAAEVNLTRSSGVPIPAVAVFFHTPFSKTQAA